VHVKKVNPWPTLRESSKRVNCKHTGNIHVERKLWNNKSSYRPWLSKKNI